MRGALVFGSVLSLILSPAPALAWWDGGHMQIAVVATQNGPAGESQGRCVDQAEPRLSELDRRGAG